MHGKTPIPFPAEITPKVYLQNCKRRFGNRNPTRITNPVWDWMIRTEYDPYPVRIQLGLEANSDHPGNPDFCFQRFGMTRTEMPDGRVIFIAGEHEDAYDPDFCIYNDVIVTRGYTSTRSDDAGYVEYDPGAVDNSAAIIEYYAYPRHTFRPTDFHTATLVGDQIYIVGSIGYVGERKPSRTPIYRLCTRSYRIERVQPLGQVPGWISKHRAKLANDGRTISISKGETLIESDQGQAFKQNQRTYLFDTATFRWRVQSG